MSDNTKKVIIPVILVAFAGGIMIAEYFFSAPVFSVIGTELKTLGVLVFSMAMIVGLVGVTLSAVKKITRRTEGEWVYNVWMLVLMYVWVAIGLIYTPTHPFYQWLFDNFITALYQSMLALPALSLFVAIYRAYKVRANLNSVLLTLSFVLVLIAGAPIGEAIWPGFTPIREWIISVPSASAERALIITMALGVIGLSLRTIVGIERTWLGVLRVPTAKRIEKEEEQ